MTFKVGDRVKYTGEADLPSKQSGIGTVREAKEHACIVVWDDGGQSAEFHDEIESETNDAVNPNHYQFPNGVETIDITRHMDFLTGNAVKYLTRAGRKGDRLTDLQKAVKYVQWAIENEENA